jgi:DNA-binding Xre family transcriptional regulator
MQKKREMLKTWIKHLYKQPPWGSAAKLSQDSGLSQNTVSNIALYGRAEADTLLKICRSAGVNPIEAFKAAGWVTDEDVVKYQSENTYVDEESYLVESYRISSDQGKLILSQLANICRQHSSIEWLDQSDTNKEQNLFEEKSSKPIRRFSSINTNQEDQAAMQMAARDALYKYDPVPDLPTWPNTRGWAKTVKELLAEQGRTQTWLADQSGVHRSNLSRWIHGKSHGRQGEPNKGEKIEIARALGVPVNLIWPDE